jgi:hypothetical protein
MLRSRASRSRYLTSSTPQTSDAIEICWSSGAEKPRIGASASTYQISTPSDCGLTCGRYQILSAISESGARPVRRAAHVAP